MKRFILVATDHGENCDGRARLVGMFDSEEEARTCAIEDMKDMVHAGKYFEVIDEEKLEIWDSVSHPFNGSVYTVLDAEHEECA